MTVSTTVALNTANGNGSTTVFNFTFRCKSAAEVAVYKDNVKQTSGFTVAVNSNGVGGTVTFTTAPANGVKVAILSDPAFTQLTSFVNAGSFLPQTHDDVNDRAAIRSIRLQSDLTRTMKVPLGETAPNLLASTARAGNYFAFDGSGNPINGISTAVMTDLQDTVSDHTAEIAQEITDRQTADSAETAARIAADTSEATLRAAADAAESSARIGADANETANRIAADSAEATARAAADLGLSNTLAAEIGNRTNATNSLLALLAGISLSSATLTAFDRNALAALDHTLGLPAILMSDGGTFIPVLVDLNTQVTADPNKGIYVPFASDTSGHSGAWVRKSERFTLGNFQCAGDNVTDDGAKINQALVTCNALGIPFLYGVGASYYSSVTVAHKAGVTLKDATIRSDATVVMSTAAGVTGHGLDNVKLIQSAGLDSRYNFDFSCTGMRVRNFECVASPTTHAVIGYFRNASSKADVLGIKTSGANGIFVQGKGHQFDDYDLNNGGGQDDGFVMKAPGVVGTPAQTEDIHFGKGFIRGFGAAIAFGSEVGLSGADDPTRASYIRGVHVNGIIGENCSQLFYFKNGAIYDYRDGDTEDIHISNYELRDLTGTAARRLCYVQWARGGRLRGIHFTNGTATFRCPNRSSGSNGGFVFLTFDYTGGSIASEVDNFTIDGVTIRDPFGGIANGALTVAGYNGVAAGSVVPGYPIDAFINTDATTGAGGTLGVLKRLEVRGLVGRGCARNAVIVANAAMITGPIRIHQPVFEDYAAGNLGSADLASIMSRAPIEIVGPMKATPSALAPGVTRGVMGDSQPDKTVEYTGETARLDLGDIAAGTPKYVTYWFDRDTWVAGVDLIVGNGGVTQNDTNYATIELKNMNPVAGGGATVVKTVTTQTNGSGGTAMAQDALISMNGTTKFTGAGAYVAKGGALRIAVTHSGAGRDIPQLAARLRFIRCGAP